MPDPGEPWASDPDDEALARELRAERLPQEDDYASYADYLEAVDAYFHELMAQSAGAGLTEKDVRREAIMLQLQADRLLREAAGE